MSKHDKDKASFPVIISFFVLLVLGPLALGAMFNEEYSLPIWVYFLVGGSILYIFFSWQTDNNSSSHVNHPKVQSRKKETKYQKSNYSSGEIVTTNIVGVTYEGRQSIVSRLEVGDGVFLERETENLHDKNAIKVSANKYSDAEQAKIDAFVIGNYDSKIKLFRDRNHTLFMKKLQLLRLFPAGQERDAKIQTIDAQISQLDSQIKDLETERRVELFKKYDTVQVGYINKELAKNIGPIFDRWAVGPTTVIDGKVIQVTGREDPKHTKGAVIQFRLPDENFLRTSIYQDMAMY